MEEHNLQSRYSGGIPKALVVVIWTVGCRQPRGDNNQQTMETNVAAPTEKQPDKAEVSAAGTD